MSNILLEFYIIFNRNIESKQYIKLLTIIARKTVLNKFIISRNRVYEIRVVKIIRKSRKFGKSQ